MLAGAQVVCCGDLRVRAVGRLGLKLRRWVELRQTVLRVFRREGGPPEGEVDVRGGRVWGRERGCRLVVVGMAGSGWVLVAEEPASWRRWRDALAKATQWKVRMFYELGEVLGSGGFAEVRKGVCRRTGLPVAVKIVPRSRWDHQVRNELRLIQALRSEHVVRLVEVFESERRFYIVQEFMKGGTLSRYLKENGPMKEKEARVVMGDVLDGIRYLHTEGVAHRDCKPDNLLTTSAQFPFKVKIADFGLAKRLVLQSDQEAEDGPASYQKVLMTTPVGSPHYVCPQVLCGQEYTLASDMWAVGIVMYEILFGVVPFDDENPSNLIQKIIGAPVVFSTPSIPFVSDGAQSMMSGLLERDPARRMDVWQAREHPWLAGV